jgi:acyl carrier protein
MERAEVLAMVSKLLTNYLRLDPDEVTEASHVTNDLGADSLALVELGFKFTESFGIGMLTPNGDNMIVGALVDDIMAMMSTRTRATPKTHTTLKTIEG